MGETERDVSQHSEGISIEAIPLPTVVVDPLGQAIATNRSWRELSGVAPDRSQGSAWLTMIEPSGRGPTMNAVRSVGMFGGTQTLEQRLAGNPRPRWTRWVLRHHDCDAGRVVVMVVTDIDADRARELDLRYRATHDSLTGVLNRAETVDMIRRALDRGERVGVIYADLDDFKTINDLGGHRFGDQVLAIAARRLRSAVRPVDSVGRVGGDEFAVVCDNIAEPSLTEEIASRIRAIMDAPVELDGKTLPIGASTGVVISRPGQSAEQLLDAADRAMYRGKRLRIRRAGAGGAPTGSHATGGDRPADVEAAIRHLLAVRATLQYCAEGASNGVASSLGHAAGEITDVVRHLRGRH